MEPYETVTVGFANSDYRNVCDTYGGGWELWPHWRELGNLLAHRPGWHFDVVNRGEALWNLGLLGESRLNIQVTAGGRFHCFDYDADSEVEVATVEEAEAWLAEHDVEAKHQPSEQMLGIARSSDWLVLKRHEFRLRVSWSDGAFAVVLPHHYDAALNPVLAEAVTGAAEMLCQLFGAPADLAAELTLRLDLDPAAVRQIRHSAA